MATYESLTPEQKEIIKVASTELRGILSSLVAFADAADFAQKSAVWDNIVQPIIDSLDQGEEIPNFSGLALADKVSKGDITNVKAWLFGIQEDIDTNRAIVAKFIGLNNR